MIGGAIIDPLSSNIRADLEVDEDVVQFFAKEDILPTEKIRLLSKSVFEFHRYNPGIMRKKISIRYELLFSDKI